MEATGSSLIYQLVCASQRLFRDRAAHHARQLTGPLFFGDQLANPDDVAAVGVASLFHDQVMVGETCDLRQVGDDQDLPLGSESLQSQADLDGGLSPMPASTSSKTSVGSSSDSAPAARIASITRDSSPPDATLASGAGTSPGLAENRISTSSAPSAATSWRDTRRASKTAPPRRRPLSSSVTARVSRSAASARRSVSSAAARSSSARASATSRSAVSRAAPRSAIWPS